MKPNFLQNLKKDFNVDMPVFAKAYLIEKISYKNDIFP